MVEQAVTTMRLTEQDRAIIARAKELYGTITRSEALRFILREWAANHPEPKKAKR